MHGSLFCRLQWHEHISSHLCSTMCSFLAFALTAISSNRQHNSLKHRLTRPFAVQVQV